MYVDVDVPIEPRLTLLDRTGLTLTIVNPSFILVQFLSSHSAEPKLRSFTIVDAPTLWPDKSMDYNQQKFFKL